MPEYSSTVSFPESPSRRFSKYRFHPCLVPRWTCSQCRGVRRLPVRPDLLLLDKLGYLRIDKRGADLLFQVVAARYETGSIVLTTNRPFRKWGALFDVDNTLATALIDRLMHHGEAPVIRLDSYRMKDKPTDPPSE